MQSARYTLVSVILYRRGYTLPLLKCLSETEAKLCHVATGRCRSIDQHLDRSTWNVIDRIPLLFF
jgi:hypothetical protein